MKFLSQINVNTEYTLPIVDGANGQVLATDGNGTAYWGSISAGATNLNALTDVVISSPSTGQLLRYGIPVGSEDPNPVWYNWSPNYLTFSSSIDALGDVTITTATAGQILQYNGTAWVNTTLSTVEYVSKVQHLVKAGVAITKGQAVYVTSSDGTNMIVGLASNASEATSSKVIGLAASTAAINDQIFVVTEGLLAGLNTSTATAGDPVWLGANGNLIFGLLGKPTSPLHLVYIGVVTRVQQNNGEIFVKVQNGIEIDEIHDVQISSPATGQLLRRDTDGYWKNWTPNFLTAEADTLATVTARGATTTSDITVNGAAFATSFSATGLLIANADTSGSLQPDQGSPANKIYSFRWQGNEQGYIDTNSRITFAGFKTPTGTASQFLKANGTVDSNTYVTSTALNAYATIDYVDDEIAGVNTYIGNNFVPNTRTLTINGTAFDLSANRSWTISTAETDTLATVTGRGASTNTLTSLLGGSKIVVQNATNGGNSNGIFMWTSGDSNWGIYMSTAATGVSLSGGNAVPSIDGRTSHHIRFRVYRSSGNGFIWENDLEQCLMSLGANNGNLYTRGQIYAGDSTSNLVWHSGNDGSGSGLDADLLDGIDSSRFVYGNSDTRRGTNLISNWNQTDYPDVAFLSAENGGANAPTNDYSYGMQYSFHRSGAAYRTQFVTSLYSDSSIWVRNSRDSDVWTSWKRLWHSGDFTSTNVTNWNTAYGWGNHSGLYLPLSGGTLTGNLTLKYSTADSSDYEGLRFSPYSDAGLDDYIIKAASDKGVFGRKSFGWHIHTQSAFGVYSSGWTQLFGVEGGTGNTQVFGSLTVNGSITESSSIRYKKDVVDIEPASSKVELLRPVRYKKIKDESQEIGLIAEDVAELFPEVVKYDNEGRPDGVNYSRLSVILLKAMQEQNAVIAALTERVNKLENK